MRCPLREGHAPSSLPHCLPPRIKSSDISFNSESWLEGSTFNQVTNTQNILIQRNWVKLSSVQFSRSVVSNSLRPHGLQHTRLPCPSPTELAQSHVHQVGDAIQPSQPVIPFSSHLQSFPASGSFPASQFFVSGGQRIGASASVLPMNIQD